MTTETDVKPDPRNCLPQPDRVLDIAYCFHVKATNSADPKDYDNGKVPPDVIMSLRVVDYFMELTEAFPRFSKEWAYLMNVSQVIISLARGLTRGKVTLEEKTKQAGRKRDKQLGDLNRAVVPSGTFKGGWKLLGPIVFGVLGFALMKAVIPGVDTSDKVEPNYISLAAGLGFALISSAITSWYNNFSIMRIYAVYDHTWYVAMDEYDIGQTIEYRRAEFAAKKAWLELTGTEAEDWPGFDDLIERQRELRNRARQEAMRLAANPVYQLVVALYERRGKKADKD